MLVSQHAAEARLDLRVEELKSELFRARTKLEWLERSRANKLETAQQLEADAAAGKKRGWSKPSPLGLAKGMRDECVYLGHDIAAAKQRIAHMESQLTDIEVAALETDAAQFLKLQSAAAAIRKLRGKEATK